MNEHDDNSQDYGTCPECGAKLTALTAGTVCLNVGDCYAAERAAVPMPGERMKAPQAFTIRGDID